jgi:Cd2+-exporting ATPase
MAAIRRAGAVTPSGGESCKGDSFEGTFTAVAGVSLIKFANPGKQSCCTRNTTYPVASMVSGVSEPGVNSTSQKSCCTSSNDPLELDTRVIIVGINQVPDQSCCSNTTIEPTSHIFVAEADDSSKKKCCGKVIATSTSTARGSNIDDCSKKRCCSTNAYIDHCSPTGEANTRPGPRSSNTIKTINPAALAQVTNVNDVDVEKGFSQVEHLVLSVGGMTCTGCEKKLFRALESLEAVSNPKTSLLLAQTEFDFVGSISIDSDKLVKTLQQMTGFRFAKMTRTGQDLDLIVDGSIENFCLKKLPVGVRDINVLDKATIRVTYNPEVVGARDILSDPFFQSAKLAPLADPPLIASGRAHTRRMLLTTLLSALLTIPVLVMAWAPLPEHDILYGAISLGLATIVQAVVAGPFYNSSFKALVFAWMIEMDLLIVLSTTTAYIYSVIAYAYVAAGQPLSTGQFFETSTLLVTLIMVGRTVSAYARQKAVESISIESLQATTALLVDQKTHQEQEIDARLLQYQDIFKVLPETSIVTDGVVITGETEVDESMITGEASLVLKRPGMPVVAGSINHFGTITVQLTRLSGENTITTIQTMVDEAKSSQPKIQEIADRVASYFVPIILLITILIFVIWVTIGRFVRHQNATTTCIVAMTYAISALIVSCPCAIGLAVPMVVVIAGGVAAKHGVIFKSTETIEIARNVSHVIFDKTGTLTQGKLLVVVEEYLTAETDSLRRLILGVGKNSKHPVSTAITAHMKASGVQPLQVENVVSVAGSGIEGTWNGSVIRAGNPHWLGFHDLPVVREVLSQGLTLFCVSVDGALVATFGLRDLLRPDATEVIQALQKRSIEISLVSGDNEAAVQSTARQVSIPGTHVRSRCTPSDKQAYVQSAFAAVDHHKSHKTHKRVVLFCGDGTNDALALAQASIGLHMNEGTDIAQGAADAVLIRPALRGVLTLMDLSRAFYRRVVFNFTWAFVYNLLAILLAAGAFPRARIPPQFAGLGEIVSVLPVIAIAVQLRWVRI